MFGIIPYMYRIYTDGSCKGNGDELALGGIGIAVFEGDKLIRKIHQPYSCTTNNRMEYKAMINAMRYVIKNSLDNVTFVSDSKLLLSTIQEWMIAWEKRGWKKSGKGKAAKIKNLDLVLRLWELKKELPANISYEWVKGHDGDEGNEIADELTNMLDGEPIEDKIDYKILQKYGVENNLAPR